MCMPKMPGQDGPTYRTPGWTRNSAMGYDPEREKSYRRMNRTIHSMGMAGVTSGAAYTNVLSTHRAMESLRGYGIAGQPMKDPVKLQSPRPAAAPAPAPAAPAPPVNPLAGLNFNIPNPPPPSRAYQSQGSPSSKKQVRARRGQSSARGKRDMTIGINY